MSSPSVCPQCGQPAPTAGKFCVHCGKGLAGAVAAPPASASPGTAATIEKIVHSLPTAAIQPLSMWWIVIPTAIFIFLSRQPVPIVIVVAIGAGLWILRTRQLGPSAPPALRAIQPLVPYAPALQSAVVFVMLGGSLFAILLVMAAAVAAFIYRRQLTLMLEPWWHLQSTIPPAYRKPLAFALPFIAGYCFGVNADGQEWTFTLISFSIGIVLAFLLLFTPPDSMRRGQGA